REMFFYLLKSFFQQSHTLLECLDTAPFLFRREQGSWAATPSLQIARITAHPWRRQSRLNLSRLAITNESQPYLCTRASFLQQLVQLLGRIYRLTIHRNDEVWGTQARPFRG